MDHLAAAATDTGASMPKKKVHRIGRLVCGVIGTEWTTIWDDLEAEKEAETETEEEPAPEEEEEEGRGAFPGAPLAPATEQEAAAIGGLHDELLRLCTPLPPRTPLLANPNAGRTLIPPLGKAGEVCSGA